METSLKMRSLVRIASRWTFCGLLIATGLYSSERVTPALAQVRTVSTTTHLPVARETFNPQTNEAVRFSDANAVFRVSFDPNGGTNIEVTAQLRGTGNGKVSGRAYEFTGGGKIKLRVSAPPASEVVLVCDGQLIAPASHTSQPITIILSVTIDSAGSVSAVVRELRAQP